MRGHAVEPGLADRLLRVRHHLGLSQSKMAAALDTSQSIVSGVENSRCSLPKHCLLRLKELGVDPVWVLSGIGTMVPEAAGSSVARDAPRISPFRSLPILGHVPAGFPGTGPAVEELEGYFPLPTRDIPDPKAFCLRVSGDSMTGFVEHGDLVVVSPMLRASLNPQDLIVVRIEPDDVLVKRYLRTDQGVVLLSSNPKYPPIIVAGHDERSVEVVGKVVLIIHRLP